MYTFKKFITEGGNIKIKTEHGEVSAAPIPVHAHTRKALSHDVHEALSSIHDSYHNAHGGHLFGEHKKALETGSAYAGSSKHLMNHHISDEEFAKHKPHVGDVDVQIPHEHKDKLAEHLKSGKKFGKYTVVGTKKHGNEVSAVMKHSNGQHHQFDFEGTHYEHNEPAKHEAFLHSSSWEDTKSGIKGMHHKALINAVGGEKHKFSMTHGLRERDDDKSEGVKDPEHVAHKLFGPKANHEDIHSFKGVTSLIKKHKTPKEQKEIYDRFKNGSMLQKKDTNHEPALAHLRKHLGIKDDLHESAGSGVTHHTTVVPLTGFSPFSHMGHAHDLGSVVKRLPGQKHIGISAKSDLFSPAERVHIMKKQWGDRDDITHHVVKSGGETIANAYNAMPQHGKKELHMVVGQDRLDMAHKLKDSLEKGKIKEMAGKRFDKIHIHSPDDGNRTHGMSGTKMRQAAQHGDYDTFSKHLGPNFSEKETKSIMSRVKNGLDNGQLKVKR